MDKVVAATIPKEKPKRKRPNAEEMLVQEARAHVFGGADPSQPESEALALVLHAEAITAAVEQQQQLPHHQYTVSTSSRSAARHSLAPQMQKKKNNEEETMALTLWKKKWAAAPPTADAPVKKRGGRGQPPPLVCSSAEITTNSSQSSLALVPVNLKQSGPKASPASISIAKPAAALFKATTLTNAAKKKQPNSNNDYDPKNYDVGNNSSARHRPSMIPIDTRWKEYPKVCEDAVDEVLTKMNQRNANEVAKAQQMRAGILDVLYLGITIKKSAEDRLVGRTTMRRYCYEVKQQLEDCLGNEQLLRQFGHQQQKKELSLKALRTEIMKAGGGGDNATVQQRAEPVNGEEEETPKGKLMPAGNRKRKAPKEAKDAEEEADQQQHIVETPPPKQKEQQNNLLKEANNLLKEANNSSVSATTSTSKRARRTLAAMAKCSTDSAAAKEKAPTADDQTLQLITAPDKPMKALISTRSGGERQRFRGTKRQLRDIVKELARSKYQGNPEDFAEVITDLIIMDRSVKKAMDRHGFPLELVQMGCRLVNRFYAIEDILDDE